MTARDWSVVFAEGAVDDLILIEQHLARAYRDFGEAPPSARVHAEARIDAIMATAERLSSAPFRDEARDDLLPGLRHLALDNAVYWYLPDALARQVRVLAVFFGGRDHQRHMLVRLLGKGGL